MNDIPEPLQAYFEVINKGPSAFENVTDYYKEVLRVFDALDYDLRVMAIHYIVQRLNHEDKLDTIFNEIVDEEGKIKKDNRNMKIWLFKFVSGVIVIGGIGFLILIFSSDSFTDQKNAISETLKVFKTILGL